jgi:hypothetical protein
MMEGPAETTVYMIAGFTVIFGSLVVYIASLVLRWRSLKQDEEMLAELEEKKAAEPKVARPSGVV